MAILRINAGPEGLSLHDRRTPLPAALAEAVRGSGPVVFMVHGFKFLPGHPVHCPHRHILSHAPVRGDPRAMSWPCALNLSQAPGGTLGVGFGWRSGFRIRPAYDRAEEAGAALASLIGRIRRIAPHRPVRAIAHSLGARVVLSALPHLAAGDVERVVLLTPAEFEDRAAGYLASPAGRRAEVLAVTSGENMIFDRLLETAIAGGWRSRAVGRARQPLPGTVNLRLDDAGTLAALARLGHPVAPPARRVCHWSSYLRPGVFGLYRALLRAEDGLSVADLRAALPAPAAAPRAWSLALRPLPVPGNAP